RPVRARTAVARGGEVDPLRPDALPFPRHRRAARGCGLVRDPTPGGCPGPGDALRGRRARPDAVRQRPEPRGLPPAPRAPAFPLVAAAPGVLLARRGGPATTFL